MILIVRDAVTNTDIKIDSLTGYVKGETVTTVSTGIPLSETSPTIKRSISGEAVQHFQLTLDE